jgi:hypothetical protein
MPKELSGRRRSCHENLRAQPGVAGAQQPCHYRFVAAARLENRTAAVALAALVASALSGSRAEAAPQTFVALEYGATPEASGCPDAEEFRASVQHQLGYDPFRADADRRVEVQIARKEIGFEGRIRWSDAKGRWVGDRRISSRRSDCVEIGAGLAFAVVVQVQLLATLAPTAPPEPAPSPPPPPPVARPPEVSVSAPPPPAAPPARRLQLAVGLGPSFALNLAPRPTGVGRLFVSGRLGHASLELALDAAWPASERQVDGSGFSLDRFAAGAAACGHAGAFAACLTATVGLLAAHGFGVDQTASPSGWFSELGGRIAATKDLGHRYFVTARVEALVMLAPWTVTLNQAPVWTTPRVGGLAGLDLGGRFF